MMTRCKFSSTPRVSSRGCNSCSASVACGGMFVCARKERAKHPSRGGTGKTILWSRFRDVHARDVFVRLSQGPMCLFYILDMSFFYLLSYAFAPHSAQNFAFGFIFAPQAMQPPPPTGFPQPEQNFLPFTFVPQSEQKCFPPDCACG